MRVVSHRANVPLSLPTNVESVKAALAEMKKEKILFQPKPYDEKLTLATALGGRKIVGAVWTLYPSPEFVEETIRGNEQMTKRNSSAKQSRGKILLVPSYGIP